METDKSVSVSRVPYQNLSAFPHLFATYCSDFDRLADFYQWNPFRSDDLVSAMSQTMKYKRDMTLLADVLMDQNSRWGLNDEVRSNIESLRSGAACAVVTGQQLGVAGGPLYTQYKAITAIQLARHLEKETGTSVVPVFWLAGEDHDFREVASVVLTPGQTVAIESSYKGPVGRKTIEKEEAKSLADAIQELHGDGVKNLRHHIMDAWRPGNRWSDAFANYLRWIFQDTGLVFISGDDARLKANGIELFVRAAESYSDINSGINKTSGRLTEKYHAQLIPRSTNLFRMTEDSRIPLEPVDRPSKNGSVSEFIKSQPGAVSPNVVLRPIFQDHLLPTVAYVGGPGEVSYFAQLKSVYEWAGVPMPVIYPRASATLIENHISRLMEKENIRFEEVDTDTERMFTSLVKKSVSGDVDSLFAAARESLSKQIEELADSVESFDPTLKKSALAIESTIVRELGKLQGKVIRAEKEKYDTLRGRIDKIAEYMYPTGKLQERSLALTHFLARYDRSFVDTLIDCLPLDTSEHVLIELQ